MKRFPHAKEIPSIPWVVIDKPPEAYDEIDRVLVWQDYGDAHGPFVCQPERRAGLLVLADALLEAEDLRAPAFAAALHYSHYICVTGAPNMEGEPVPGVLRKDTLQVLYPGKMGRAHVPTLFIQGVGREALPMRESIHRLFGAWNRREWWHLGVHAASIAGVWYVAVNESDCAPNGTPLWSFVAWQDRAMRRFILQSIPLHRDQEEQTLRWGRRHRSRYKSV